MGGLDKKEVEMANGKIISITSAQASTLMGSWVDTATLEQEGQTYVTLNYIERKSGWPPRVVPIGQVITYAGHPEMGAILWIVPAPHGIFEIHKQSLLNAMNGSSTC
ncbi:MAG: hypothetical protein Q7S76_01170 [bacterium]|nr:hypothetical protein [bacterium]